VISFLRLRASTRHFVRGLVFSGCALAWGTEATPVQASGPVEAFFGAAVDPSNPSRLVLRYTNTGSRAGLLYSLDAGATFGLLCTDGIAASALSAPDGPAVGPIFGTSLSRMRMMHVTDSGTTLIGSGSGLVVDDGTGCTWRAASELAGLYISGIARHPKDGRVAFIVTNGATAASNEGLWRRDADGSLQKLASWPKPPVGETRSQSGLLVASRGSGLRFYSLSLRSRNVLLVSDDQGKTWREHTVEADERAWFELVAVDPTDADRLVAVLRRSSDSDDPEFEKDTIVVSHDGGASFKEYVDVTELSGVLFAEDGTLWIGDAGKTTTLDLPMGLYRAAPGLTKPPEQLLSDEPVTCLAQRPGASTLYACRRFEFGTFDPESKKFTKLVDTLSVQQFVSCDGRDVVKDCRNQLCESGWCGPGHFAKAPFCAAYNEPYCGNHADGWDDEPDSPGSPGRPGAGVRDSGVPPIGSPQDEPDGGPAANPPSSRDKGRDCSVRGAGLGSSPWFAWAAGLFVLPWALSRRKRLARSVSGEE
jgi:hypothetical protein